MKHPTRGGPGYFAFFDHLPPAVRAELLAVDAAPPRADSADIAAARDHYLKASAETRRRADKYAQCVTRMEAEMAVTGETFSAAAKRLAPAMGISEKTLRDKYRIASAAPQDVRAWLLAPGWKPNKARWTDDEEAFWARVIAQMTGTEGWFPLREGYRRAADEAIAAGQPTVTERRVEHRWRQLGASETTLILCGEAERDRRHLPSQRRLRPPYAMHTLCIDARQTRIWCRFDDGTEGRAWEITAMDVHSWKVLGFTLSKSEDTPAIRETLLKIIAEHGIPQFFQLDNGSSNATFGLGSVRDREMSDDERSLELRSRLLPRLNINAYFALPENGREKPIERVFRDMKKLDGANDIRDRGAFDGRTDMSKSRPRKGFIPAAELREMIGARYREWNARLGRRGFGMNGRSHDQAFEEGLALRAQHGIAPPPRLSPAQLDIARREAHQVKPTQDKAEVILHDGKLVFATRNHTLRDAIFAAARRSPTAKIIALIDPNAPENGALVEGHDGKQIGTLRIAERRAFVSGDHERRVNNADKRAQRREKDAERARLEALLIKHAAPAPSGVPDLPAPHPAGPVIAPIFGVKLPREFDTDLDDLEQSYVTQISATKEKRASGGNR